MTNDAEWVEDVRRWYFASVRSSAPDSYVSESTDLMALGYEAAHPALQARHWPDAPATGFGDAR